MTNLLLVNRNDLTEILEATIKEIFAEQKAPEKEVNRFLSFDEGLEYLNEKGIKISKSHLYKKTSAKDIPFRRFGDRKIVFEPETLDKWISEQLSEKGNAVLETIAKSARRKEYNHEAK